MNLECSNVEDSPILDAHQLLCPREAFSKVLHGALHLPFLRQSIGRVSITFRHLLLKLSYGVAASWSTIPLNR